MRVYASMQRPTQASAGDMVVQLAFYQSVSISSSRDVAGSPPFAVQQVHNKSYPCYDSSFRARRQAITVQCEEMKEYVINDPSVSQKHAPNTDNALHA